MIQYLCNGDPTKIPDNTTHLTFGDEFNQPVDNLPNSITLLIFGENFNQPVDNLPNSIKHLSFGLYFNQPLDNLPNSIISINFGAKFNQSIDNLPNSLVCIEFKKNSCFNKSVDNIIKFVKIFHFNDYNSYQKYRDKLSNNCIIHKSDIKFLSHYVFYEHINFKKHCYGFGDIYNIAELQYFVHNTLLKKLTEYVFNPQRLQRFAEKYNLSFEEYMDFL